MKGTPEPAREPQGLASRLAWVIGLRLACLLVFLGATTFLYLRGSLADFSYTMRIVYGAIAAGFVSAAVYAFLLRRGRGLVRLAYTQLLIDPILWSALAYISGGVASGATSLYGLTCLVGAVLIGLRGALVGATASLVSYLLLAFSLHSGVLPSPPDQSHIASAMADGSPAFPLFMSSVLILAVAFLSGYLAERLRHAGGALELATLRYTEAERFAEIGRVATWLAHEIRNPLGSILGSVEMLHESKHLDDEERELCAIVQREAARLNELVRDMLDLSKARETRASRTDLAALAFEVVVLARRLGGLVQVDFEGDKGLFVLCDEAQIRQVVWNLLRNAMQATPAGKSVTVRSFRRGDEVIVSVRDQGPGIPKSERARIFDAFYSTRSHGSGVGLALVKRIVDDHAPWGGRIDVTSDPGQGARFDLVLRNDAPPVDAVVARTY